MENTQELLYVQFGMCVCVFVPLYVCAALKLYEHRRTFCISFLFVNENVQIEWKHLFKESTNELSYWCLYRHAIDILKNTPAHSVCVYGNTA